MREEDNVFPAKAGTSGREVSAGLYEAPASAGVTMSRDEARAMLEQGFEALEEEAVRERLAAAERYRAGIAPEGERATEFDRQMKLLAYWRRRDGTLGPRARSRQALKTWSFDESMKALEKRLKALNIPIVKLPKKEGDE